MSAHHGAPGFRRPQLATPAFTTSPQASSMPARSGGRPRVRRKDLFVAAATLCAPAFAALALAALAATGGGNQAAMGSLAGTQGLRGTTSPSLNAAPPAIPDKGGTANGKSHASDSLPVQNGHKHQVQKAPPRDPVHHPSQSPPRQIAPAPRPHLNSPIPPPFDPSQPGAPTGSTTTGGSTGTSGTSGSSGSGTSSSPGSGSSSLGNSAGSSDGGG
jgi:hypothetical protein